MDLILVGGAIAVVGVGLAIGRAWERESAKERQRNAEERDRNLGLAGPIAVLWAAGRLTDETAERELNRFLDEGPLQLWRQMDRDEKLRLAEHMVRLSQDPVWQAQQVKTHKVANELRAEFALLQEQARTGGQA